MIYSMTAFARQQQDASWGTLVWEIRSVNHRYLEPSIRLPENFRGLEPALRESLRGRLNRGKIECQLRFQPAQHQHSTIRINREQVEHLAMAAARIQSMAPSATALSVQDILRWPGVLDDSDSQPEEIEQAALALFESSLQELVETRHREGMELGRLIEARLVSVADIVARVRSLLPDILTRQRQLILDRLAEIRVELDPARLEQEIALLAQKCDVDEELDRLDAHIAEVRRVLTMPGQVGRRLDFLMQELNREANTLSSKSVVAETTRNAVELKVLIEQMREQIQNIE
ncbi:MAG: hypothetical protein RLZZ385_2721 [Pseudomonadota bacterium]|jgi:uncharacterized protein (TIGR00255 family)